MIAENGRARFFLRAKVKSQRLTALIVAAFIICWTPYQVVFIVHTFIDTQSIDTRYIVWIFFFGMANSVVNPMIYGALQFCTTRQNKQRRRFVTTSAFQPPRPLSLSLCLCLCLCFCLSVSNTLSLPFQSFIPLSFLTFHISWPHIPCFLHSSFRFHKTYVQSMDLSFPLFPFLLFSLSFFLSVNYSPVESTPLQCLNYTAFLAPSLQPRPYILCVDDCCLSYRWSSFFSSALIYFGDRR